MKRVIVAILLLIAVAIPLAVFAEAPYTGGAGKSCGKPGTGQPGLTEQQRRDMLDSSISVLIAKKEAVGILMKSGVISKEQGETVIARLDMEIEYRGKYGMMKRGIVFDPESLTKQQEKDLLDAYVRVMEARMDFVEKMVKNGSMTREQGDRMIAAIKRSIEQHREKGFRAPLRFFDVGSGSVHGKMFRGKKK
jgi:hypothetical protein